MPDKDTTFLGLQRDDPNILLYALRADMSSMVESMAWIKNNISMMAHVPATVAGLTEKVAANTTEIRELRVRSESIDELKLSQSKIEGRVAALEIDIIPDGKIRMENIEKVRMAIYGVIGTSIVSILAFYGKAAILPFFGIHL